MCGFGAGVPALDRRLTSGRAAFWVGGRAASDVSHSPMAAATGEGHGFSMARSPSIDDPSARLGPGRRHGANSAVLAVCRSSRPCVAAQVVR
jgi:hypothetical protein